VSLDHLCRPLVALLADGQQGDPRPGDAQHRLREGGAEEGELDEVDRASLGVGSHVKQQGGRPRPARNRELHGERRAPHALQAPKREQRRGHRRARGSRARHRV